MTSKPLATPQGQRIDIPASTAAAATSWAPIAQKWCRDQAKKHGLCPPPADLVLKIGTDCSGLDSPVLAMKAMGFRIEHLFSSETVSWKRDYIRLNSSPRTTIFEDMLRREHENLPLCDIYCCGFSCKPFSSLHNRSKLFREKEARVFFGAVRTIRAMHPPVAILENVVGIRKVMTRVLKELKGLGRYAIVVCHLDPRDAGEPVSRPRTYFVLVRLDLLVVPLGKLHDVAADVLGDSVVAAAAPLESRLLPAGCGLLSRFTAPATPRSKANSRRGKKLYEALRAMPRAPLGSPIAGLSERAAATLEATMAKLGLQDLPPQNIDVSQSMGRCRFTDVVPTITPGAKIVIGSRRRLLHPVEMLLLNGIPVGELTWPSSFEGRHLADMAGNTMHCLAAPSLSRAVGVLVIVRALPAIVYLVA